LIRRVLRIITKRLHPFLAEALEHRFAENIQV